MSKGGVGSNLVKTRRVRLETDGLSKDSPECGWDDSQPSQMTPVYPTPSVRSACRTVNSSWPSV